MKSLCNFLVLSQSFLVLASCTGINNSQYYEYLTTDVEQAVCLDSYNYASNIQLNGIAKFFKRGIEPIVQTNTTTNLPELKNLILGDPLQEAMPIRYAEVVVLNSNRQIVQCGRTDDLGYLKATDGFSDLFIPATPGNYTVQVLSRVYATFENIPGKPPFNLDAAVKKDKYTNKLYTLEDVVFSNGVDEPTAELIAYARQTESPELTGGAFNILNDTFIAYSYLYNNTNNDPTDLVNLQCLSNRVNVYWKAGFNPHQYLEPDVDPENITSIGSFYTNDSDRSIYIGGGNLGNVSIVDTDHFDDYVILHELGHYIEDHCGYLTSRGGQHLVTTRIEPRLAWTESWANYFAAQVLFNDVSAVNKEFPIKMDAQGFSTLDQKWSYFATTFGYSDSSLNVGNGDGIAFDLKKPGNNPDSYQSGSLSGYTFDKVDPTRFPGEGHYREGAISRGLFKLTNSCGPNCATSPMPFEEVWNSAMSPGFGIPEIKFKSSHDILFLIDARGLAGWNSVAGNGANEYQEILEGEALQLVTDSPNPYIETVSGDFYWIPYASILELKSDPYAACSIKTRIQPRVDDPILTGVQSDQRYSNHYYLVDFDFLSDIDTISVKFTRNAGTPTEFDLILYEENYFFAGDYDCQPGTSGNSCQKYPIREVASDMVRADRSSNTTFKKLTRLLELDRTKKYILNIRAYTPGKFISATTDYSYEIRDGLVVDDGKFLCL